MYIGRARIFFNVCERGGFGDREDWRQPRQKGERDLARGRLMCLRDICEQATLRRISAWKIAVPEWTVGGDRETVLLAPGDHGMFDRSLLQMIEHLIAGNARVASDTDTLFKIRHVEVAHAPGEYFALLPEFLESRESVFQRMRSAPVQQVAIQPIGPEAGERSLASDLRPPPRRILWQHLGDQEHLVSPSRDGVADQLLGGAGPVHFRGVDVVHSEIDAAAQGGARGGAVAFLDVPGPQANDADLALQGAEPPLSNAGSVTAPGLMRHGVAPWTVAAEHEERSDTPRSTPVNAAYD